MNTLKAVHWTDLLDFSRKWNDLGEAVQGQVEAICENPCADVNESAIRFAFERLNGTNDELDKCFDAYCPLEG